MSPTGKRVAPAPGRRVAATRRPLFRSLPSTPVLMGIAALGISVGGALQVAQPGLTDASAPIHRLAEASALGGSSGVARTSILASRGQVVSRSASRDQGTTDLRATAEQQAKARDAALADFAKKAEAQAARIKVNQWVLPVATGVYHLTAGFGDVSYLWSSVHTGLDFAAPTGTSIMAVGNGVIDSTGYSGAYGNRTVETLPDGTELWYCHQTSFLVSPGETVTAGETIGTVGSTGNVTGPHLHLEVHPGGGDPVDPYAALVAHGLQP
ncbi:MAG: M23 family metallopeptidase [Nocardioides sp.]